MACREGARKPLRRNGSYVPYNDTAKTLHFVTYHVTKRNVLTPFPEISAASTPTLPVVPLAGAPPPPARTIAPPVPFRLPSGYSPPTMPAITVNDRVTIPDSAIETKAVRSSGPGGQNVNKLATKIQMWIALDQVQGFIYDDLARVRTFLKSRLDADGRLLVMSQETRDQAQNREDCASKAADLIRAALVRPKVRRKTKPSRASKQRRIEAKRLHSDRIRNRRIDE